MDRTEMLDRIDQHYATFWQGNLDDLEHQLAPDFVDEESQSPPGWEHVRDHAATSRIAFPDMTVTTDEAVVEGSTAAVLSTWRGTHLGEVGDVEPTGRNVSVRGIVIWRFDSQGRIVRRIAQLDRSALMAQITSSEGE